MHSTELHWATIAQLCKWLANGELSSVELTGHLLKRIAKHDTRLNAFIYLAEDALNQALASDRRRRKSPNVAPLEGIPIALKDNYLTRDMPTMAGSNAPNIEFPQTDSTCAELLRASGCVMLGKTRTHEFAWGTVTPPVANPWDTDRIPGGSSGGSAAAVAAGLVPMAMGSDTGGSIRIPASFCGVVGIKPTFGRVSRHGIVPHSWSLDHPGPLTRTVEDAAIVMQVIAGYDPRDPACQSQPIPDFSEGIGRDVQGLRIGVIDNHFMDRNAPDVQASIKEHLTHLQQDGARIIHFKMPILAYGLAAIYAIELASSGAYHDDWIKEGVASHYHPDVRALVEMGRLVSAVDYLKAEQIRTVMAEEFKRIFEQVDVIITPTEPLTAWKHGQDRLAVSGNEESVLAASWRLTYPFNLTGLPAISVPCGFDHLGMPIGLQIAGRPFDEVTVLRCAAAVEKRAAIFRHPF